MKLPISWLKEYVDVDVSVDELADRLSLSGSEVEHIESAQHFDKNIVVSEILKISSHPNADKLHIVSLDTGAGKTLDIVCGASNIEAGQKVPLALEGSKVGDFEIKEAEIRGVKSKGMICSEKELGISEESDGIMILDPKIKPGTIFNELFPKEFVLDLDITPNRQDCLSIIGLAREVSVVLRKKLRLPDVKIKEGGENTGDIISVSVADPKFCPRYMARVIKIKNNGSSPDWLKKRLLSSGVRPINKVVDVTNYVMLETGEPLHGFDLSKLADQKGAGKGPVQIFVRKAKAGEEIETLDGKLRKLDSSILVIANSEKPIAIAGIMGGEDSGADENTKTVVLEAAVFDYLSIRRSSRKLGLRSESSARFEKGLPLKLPEYALDKAASMIAELCDGTVQKGKIDVLDKWIWTQHVGFRKSWLDKFVGQEISTKECLRILNGLGFEAEEFDIVKEARKHVGKPYAFGAKFKTHGTDAFDCSYLSDYIYSKIGKFIGYTSLAQIELGEPVKDQDLKLGDILFVKGVIDKSVTDHYFIPDGKGGYKKITTKNYPKGVGHNAIYVGDGKIVHARHYSYDGGNKKWARLPEGEVVEDSADLFLKNPEYLGARRYTEDLDDYIAVTVPWWRLDVSMEQDLAEEIVRIFGYGNIVPTMLRGELPDFKENKRYDLVSNVKRTLAGSGFSEVYNYSFLNGKYLSAIREDLSRAFKLENPSNPDQEYVKTSLLPHLLLNVSQNQNFFDGIKIFEVSNVYTKVGGDAPVENRRLAGAVVDGGIMPFKYDEAKEFYVAKGALENLLTSMGLSSEVRFESYKGGPLDHSRSAEILIQGKSAGRLGETDREVMKAFGIKKSVALFDIDLDLLSGLIPKQKAYKEIPRFPSIKRDLSFVVDTSLPVQKILEVANKSEAKHLQNIKITDIYYGKELGENKKSVTVSLEFISKERTLEDKEADIESTKIVQKIKQKLGGELRDV